MKFTEIISEPFLFNPLKHHLGYLKNYVVIRTESPDTSGQVIKDLRQIGTAAMDIYKGTLNPFNIYTEIYNNLASNNLLEAEKFSTWTGKGQNQFRLMQLSDNSQWILKFHADSKRYIHFFPARGNMNTFRVRANSLKSAIMYLIIIGKDFINIRELNYSRKLIGLSPVKDPLETEAICDLIEILRL